MENYLTIAIICFGRGIIIGAILTNILFYLIVKIMEKKRIKMDIVNEASSQEQMAFLEWFAEEYPDFWDKVSKEYDEILEETE
jgi:hypothetical protein